MLNNLLTSVFGSRNERLLRQLQKTVTKINSLESGLVALTDDELKAKTPEFKERIAKGESLDKILPEAFAVCREASKRVLGMRHFDTQLIGGMVLHLGKIAEMRTGEGKTLVGTLPGRKPLMRASRAISRRRLPTRTGVGKRTRLRP